MIDLNQAAAALRNATPRSLVLFDELGKGTVSSGKVLWKDMRYCLPQFGLLCYRWHRPFF